MIPTCVPTFDLPSDFHKAKPSTNCYSMVDVTGTFNNIDIKCTERNI